jgi:O-antigen chain-terminating methyltransferase
MQAASTVKRELDRLQARVSGAGAPVVAAGGPTAASAPAPTPPALPTAAAVPSFQQAAASSIDSFKYVGFEDRFRGSREEIRARQETYVECFTGRSAVVDIGCGRGEFLDLLRERGIDARGLDLNREMVELCLGRGLRAEEGDAVGFLRRQPDGSLGGLVALQVVEHLQPDYLLQFLDAAYHALAPGSPIVLETINPTCWAAFFESYVRDITHARPIHPDTLSYYASASGFQKVTVHYSAPCPEEWKLRRVEGDSPAAQALNHNVDLLNARLFTYQDFALLAERL